MTDISTLKQKFAPNVPEKLIARFLKCNSNMSRLARELDINKGHVHNLLKHGKEPRDKTIRSKLFLPARIREDLPAWVIEATDNLAALERAAAPKQNRTYNRKGKRT